MEEEDEEEEEGGEGGREGCLGLCAEEGEMHCFRLGIGLEEGFSFWGGGTFRVRGKVKQNISFLFLERRLIGSKEKNFGESFYISFLVSVLLAGPSEQDVAPTKSFWLSFRQKAWPAVLSSYIALHDCNVLFLYLDNEQRKGEARGEIYARYKMQDDLFVGEDARRGLDSDEPLLSIGWGLVK